MKTLNLVVIGLVAVLLAAILVVLILRPPGKGHKKPPLKGVDAGETVTKEGIVAQNQKLKPAPAPVDNTRVQATYEKGKTYVNLVNGTVTSKGSYKDWGVVTDSTFNYVSEFQISRFITKNDGNIIEMDVRVDRACSLGLFFSTDGIHFDLPPLFHAALEPIGMAYGLPPGSTEITLLTAEKVMNTDIARNYVNQIATGKLEKAFAWVDTLEGKKAHVIFEMARVSYQ